MADISKPSSKFILKIGGEDHTVVMSFALFQEIMKVIPSPEDIASLLIQDFYLREWVVRRLLTGNKRVKTDEDLVDLFELDLDEEEIDDLCLWVTDHVLYFFTTTVEKSMVLGTKYRDKVSALIQSRPSPTGSPN